MADGSPRTTKEGRYFIKGRRKPRPGAPPSKKGPPAPKPAPKAEAPAPAAAAPAPSALPAELSAIPVASPADILGRPWPEPTVDDAPESPDATDPDPAPTPADVGAAAPSSEPTPAGSYIAPDAPPPAAPIAAQGLAFALVAVAETSARVGIDPVEWELATEERADLAVSVQKVLDKHGIAPELSPEGELVLKLAAVTARRAPLPKTRAAIKNLFGWVTGLFRPKPAPLAETMRAPTPAPTAPAPTAPTPDKPLGEAESTAPTAPAP